MISYCLVLQLQEYSASTFRICWHKQWQLLFLCCYCLLRFISFKIQSTLWHNLEQSATLSNVNSYD